MVATRADGRRMWRWLRHWASRESPPRSKLDATPHPTHHPWHKVARVPTSHLWYMDGAWLEEGLDHKQFCFRKHASNDGQQIAILL